MCISSRHNVWFHPWCRVVVTREHIHTHFQFKLFKSRSPLSPDAGQQEGTEMLAAPVKSSEEKHTEDRFQLHHGCFTNQPYLKITLFFFCLPFCSCKWFTVCACTFDLLITASDLTVKFMKMNFMLRMFILWNKRQG